MIFEKFLEEFIPTKKLAEYLKKKSICDFEMADIIFCSKASIERKREALCELENMDISEEKRRLREYWTKYRKSIDEALRLIDSEDAVFVVYEYSIYEPDSESDEWMHGLFSSYDAAFSFVKNDSESKKDDKDLIHWYVINIWIKCENNAYKDTCNYYIIDDELCYAEFDISSEYYESCTDGELRIPVHYKPGDILIADCYPFGNKVKFVMLQIGDNHDCCCLQALSRKKDGSWDVGAVKHGMIGNMSYPRISVLYTADTYNPDLSDSEDAILAKVSEIVSGDESRGNILWDKFSFNNISNDEDMWDVLNDTNLLEN